MTTFLSGSRAAATMAVMGWVLTLALGGCGGKDTVAPTAPPAASGVMADAASTYASYPPEFEGQFTQSCAAALGQANPKTDPKSREDFCRCSAQYIMGTYSHGDYNRRLQGARSGNAADVEWQSKTLPQQIKRECTLPQKVSGTRRTAPAQSLLFAAL